MFYHCRLIALLGVLLAGARGSAQEGPPRYALTNVISLGGDHCKATALNEGLEVVGRYRARDASWPQPFERAFVLASNRLVQLPLFIPRSQPAIDAHAADLNAEGMVVGWVTTNHAQFDRTSRAVYWQDGKLELLPPLGGTNSLAYAVNARGDIVGAAANAQGLMRAFLWQRGRIAELGTLGGATSYAYAINDKGQITGESTVANWQRVAFLYQQGRMSSLGTLGGGASRGNAINENGEVAGVSQTRAGQFHAFVLRDRKLEDLGTLGGPSSYAAALNLYHVVGVAEDRRQLRRAFVHDGKRMWDLNALIPPNSGWFLTEATDINDTGAILCMARHVSGTLNPVLLIPLKPAR